MALLLHIDIHGNQQDVTRTHLQLACMSTWLWESSNHGLNFANWVSTHLGVFGKIMLTDISTWFLVLNHGLDISKNKLLFCWTKPWFANYKPVFQISPHRKQLWIEVGLYYSDWIARGQSLSTWINKFLSTMTNWHQGSRKHQLLLMVFVCKLLWVTSKIKFLRCSGWGIFQK